MEEDSVLENLDVLSLADISGLISGSGTLVSTIGSFIHSNEDDGSVTQFNGEDSVVEDAASLVTLDSDLKRQHGNQGCFFSGCPQLVEMLFNVLRKTSPPDCSDDSIRQKITSHLNDPERWEVIEQAFADHFQSGVPLCLPNDLLEGRSSFMMQETAFTKEMQVTPTPRKFKHPSGKPLCSRCGQPKKNHRCSNPPRKSKAWCDFIKAPPPRSKRDNKTSDSGRGRYRCGRCRELKANHVCPFRDDDDDDEDIGGSIFFGNETADV